MSIVADLIQTFVLRRSLLALTLVGMGELDVRASIKTHQRDEVSLEVECLGYASFLHKPLQVF